MPIIHNKNSNNGAMLIKHKGHLRKYDFNEYSGFNTHKGNSLSEENYFYPLELPDYQLSNLQNLITTLSVGNGFFFNANLPHTSATNESDKLSYALIAKLYDYRKDLTLSDRTRLKSYKSGASGYPRIRPII